MSRDAAVAALVARYHDNRLHHYRGGVDDSMAKATCKQNGYRDCTRVVSGVLRAAEANGWTLAPAASEPLREALDTLDGLATAVIRMKLAIPAKLTPTLPADFFHALGDVNQWLDRNDRVQSRAALATPLASDPETT